MTTRRGALAMSLACGVALAAPTSIARAADGHIAFGTQWWEQSAPEAKFQEFREVPYGGFVQNWLWNVMSADGVNSATLWGANSIRKDQSTRATLASGAKWRLDLGYQKLPHLLSQIAVSPYVQVQPGAWALPDTLQARNQTNPNRYTQTMTDLLNNSPNIPLDFTTNVFKGRLRAKPVNGWEFEARGENRLRSGQKPYAITFGFNTAIEVPEPINQRMQSGDLIANYRHDQFAMQASAGISAFRNAVSTMFVDNPKRVTDANGGDGPKTGALDLYPDNMVYRSALALSYMMPKRTSLAATFGFNRGRQDESFLKPTNNSAHPQSTLDSLPARSLDAVVNQLVADLRLRASPVSKLDGALRYRYTKYDSKTEPLLFTGMAPYDVTWQRWIGLEAEPANNSQMTGGVDLDYRLTRKIRMGGTAEYRTRTRTDREVEKDHETVLAARAAMQATTAMELGANYWHGDRQLDEFLYEDYLGYRQRAVGPSAGVYDSLAVVEQPNLRRYDVANRLQDKVTTGIGYAVGENVDLNGTYMFLTNNYIDSPMGLQYEKQQTASLGGTYHLNPRIDLNGAVGFDWTRTRQKSRQSSSAALSTTPVDDWSAKLSDDDQYYQVGFSWDARPDRLTFLGDYQFSFHYAKFHLTNATNTAQDVPNTVYQQQQVRLEAQYRVLRATTLSARYGWEDYFTNDWATTDVPLIFPVTGTANAIFLGDSRLAYHANSLALLLNYNF